MLLDALKKGQFLNDFMALHCIAQVDLQQEREILRQGEKKLEETLKNIVCFSTVHTFFSTATSLILQLT